MIDPAPGGGEGGTRGFYRPPSLGGWGGLASPKYGGTTPP